MTDDSRSSISPERRAEIRAQNHAAGRVITIIGAVLVVATLVVVYGMAVVISTSDDPYTTAQDTMQPAMTTAGVLLLFALCGLILGEQLRRGGFGMNETPPDTVLPSATVVSSFRVLAARWHIVWGALSLVVAATLLLPPVIGALSYGWPQSIEGGDDIVIMWTLYGAVAFSTGVTILSSLSKKKSTARAVAAGRAVDPARQGAWRLSLYRWRVDVWLVAVGALLVAAGAEYWILEATREDDASGPAIVAVLGVVITVTGIILGRQFWRTGESLGTGESFA